MSNDNEVIIDMQHLTHSNKGIAGVSFDLNVIPKPQEMTNKNPTSPIA